MYKIYCIIFCVCTFTTLAHADVFENLNPQKEIEIGQRASRVVEHAMPISPDKGQQERVNRVGKAIVEQLASRQFAYQFKVLASSDFNAFSLPGGYIYVTDGALAHLDTDDELAFVLAHEVTHVCHHHAVGYLGTGPIESLQQVMNSLIYSRAQEYDADHTAMDDLWKAGFNLSGGTEAMKIILGLEAGPKMSMYIVDHPYTKTRLTLINKYLQELLSKPRPTAPTALPPPPDVPVENLVGVLPQLTLAPNPSFPLAVGNEWTYAVQQGSGAKTLYSLRITGVISVPGGTVYTAETVLNQKTTIACQFATTENAIWRRNRPTSPQSVWVLEHVTTVATGATRQEQNVQYTAPGQETIGLPCGTFIDAIKIHKVCAAPVQTTDIWFAEGIGMLKRVCTESGVTETLVNYHLAQPL